ncbi:MAG: DUF4266 domain-containing protein [Gammaproteobacteria bacterium]|nr:DUF4266 domain-containing protein [Gammaproteobacteria bacterium]
MRPIRAKLTQLMIFGVLLSMLAGCSYLNPKPLKPWDRDVLARPEMQLDADSMEDLMDTKIYFSKEASRGGANIGGGGCGCN